MLRPYGHATNLCITHITVELKEFCPFLRLRGLNCADPRSWYHRQRPRPSAHSPQNAWTEAGTIAFICSPLLRLTATYFEIWLSSICLLRLGLRISGFGNFESQPFFELRLTREFCQLVRNCAFASSMLAARPLVTRPRHSGGRTAHSSLRAHSVWFNDGSRNFLALLNTFG